MLLDSKRRILEKMLWNVPIHTFEAIGVLIKSATLVFISDAALLVNVRARIFQGITPWANKKAILEVKTLVFPEPAPAITSEGPSMYVTALYCSLFNFSRKEDIFLKIIKKGKIWMLP